MYRGNIIFRFSKQNKIVIGCTVVLYNQEQVHLCESCEGCKFMGKTKEELESIGKEDRRDWILKPLRKR
jgi:hypothetical protein